MSDDEDEFDKMIRVLSAPDPGAALDAMAYATGLINPHGSFLRADVPVEQLTAPLSWEERRTRLSALPWVEGVHMPVPKPPPVNGACSGWVPAHQHSLWPGDYHGLGVGPDGVFRIDVLKRHCSMAPGAVDSAMTCALAQEGRELRCQALRCARPLRAFDADQLHFCHHCLLGVYCGACATIAIQGTTLCRVCLLYSAVTEMPIEWMWRRASALRAMLDRGGTRANDPNAECYETVIQLMAPRAVRNAVQRVAYGDSAPSK